MSKKVFFFISFILVLTLGRGALGQGANHLCLWTDAGPDSNLWSDANNWYTVDWNGVDDTWVKSSANSVPAADDIALIGQGASWFPYPNDVAALGPIGQCVLDSDAVCFQLYIGADPCDPNQPNHLEMTGGSLTIGLIAADAWWGLVIGGVDGGSGSMNLSGGTVDIGHLYSTGGQLLIGLGTDSDNPEGGTGTLTMTGGTLYCYHLDCPEWDQDGSGEGHLNLYGGTIYTTTPEWWAVWMSGPEKDPIFADPCSSIDVTEGKIITSNDDTEGQWTGIYQLNQWIEQGVITAYGGVNPRAEFYLDAGITNPGGTTLAAWGPENDQQAYHPSPIFGGLVGLDNPTLTWTPGDGAVSHIVYCSSSFEDVNDGTAPNTPTGVASYSAGILDWETTYYWRVDEVNASETVQEGAVWVFKTDTHLNIDDMESYDVDNPIDYEDETTGTWKESSENGTRSDVSLEIDIVYGGSASMEFRYTSGFSPYYAEIEADVADLEIGSDWAVAGAKSVLLHFFGQEDNYGEPMYFGVEDSRGAVSYAQVTYDNDNNTAIQIEQWQQWNIDLEDFNSAGVHLSDIQTVYLGIGIKGATEYTGDGYVYFDEIELWPQRCRPEESLAYGDVSDAQKSKQGDCYIDEWDLWGLGRDWLLKSDWVFASEPVPGPVGHWRFDEGSETVATNIGSLGEDFNGELMWMGARNWVTPGAPAPDNPDPNWALYFSGVDDYVSVPDFNSAPGGFTTDSATLTAWVKRDGDQVDFAGIVMCTGLGESWGPNSQVIAGISVGAAWDTPVSTNKLKYHWYDESGDDYVGWWADTELFIPNKEWTFVAVSIEPTQATLYMMPPGGEMEIFTHTENVHVEATFDQPIHIGQDPRDFDGHRRWTGWIDDVRIYDYALNDEEIAYAALGSEESFWKELESWRADIHDDSTVDFKDYAVLADHWLEGPMLWP